MPILSILDRVCIRVLGIYKLGAFGAHMSFFTLGEGYVIVLLPLFV